MSQRKWDKGERGVKEVTYPAFSIFHNQHKSIPQPSQIVTLLIKRPQTHTILFKTVYQAPFLAQLQPCRHEQPNFLRQGLA